MKKFSIILLVFAFYSCGVNDKQNKDASQASVEMNSEKLLELSDLSMKISSAWKQETPTGQMRIAQLASVNNPAVKLVVFYFGQQDMIEANVQRWKGQFVTLTSEQELDMKDKNVTAIKLKGTFKKKDFPMAQDFTEVPGYAMLAAIVPSATGPYYFRLVAEEEIIEELEADFVSLINSNKEK